MKHKNMTYKVYSVLVANLLFLSPLISAATELKTENKHDAVLESTVNKENKTKEATWLATELEGNQPFIDQTVSILKKAEADITLEDLATIKELNLRGAASIPEKISDYTSLETLYVTFGTVSEIPESLFQLNKTLRSLGLRDNKLITLPDKLFDDTFWTAKSNGLTLTVSNNQIVSDVPKDTGTSGMLDFNSKNNMLEHFHLTDYHDNKQAQLSFQGATPNITVPVGYNFNESVPDSSNLKIYSAYNGYENLFPGHQFVYYDDNTSANTIQNGVATHVGNGKIWIKSKFSTITNRFAKVQVNVKVEKESSVIVRYTDTEGNKLIDDILLKGKVGETYTTEQREIAGYSFTRLDGEASGKFAEDQKVIIYVYTKDPEPTESSESETESTESETESTESETESSESETESTESETESSESETESTESETESTESTESEKESTESETESTESETESTESETESTESETESTESETESTESETESTESETESTESESETESTETETESTESETESTESETESTESETESTESETESTESEIESTESETESTESETESTESETESTESEIESTESATESTESETESTESATESTETKESSSNDLQVVGTDYKVSSDKSKSSSGEHSILPQTGEKKALWVTATGGLLIGVIGILALKRFNQ